jgi:uncharacterized membrane protein
MINGFCGCAGAGGYGLAGLVVLSAIFILMLIMAIGCFMGKCNCCKRDNNKSDKNSDK